MGEKRVSLSGVIGEELFGFKLDQFTQKVDLHLRQKIATGFFQAYEEIVYRTPEDTDRAGTSWQLTVAKEANKKNQPSAKIYLSGDEKSEKGKAEWEYDYDIVDSYPTRDEVVEQGGKNLWRFLRRQYKTKKVATKQAKSGYRVQKQFTKFVTRGPIWVTNSVSYLPKLEFGYSRQDKYFVREALAKMKRFFESDWEGPNFKKGGKKKLTGNEKFVKILTKKEKTPLVGSSTLGLIGTSLPFKTSDGQKKVAWEDLSKPIDLDEMGDENWWREIANYHGRALSGELLTEVERRRREKSGDDLVSKVESGRSLKEKKHTWRPDEVMQGRRDSLLPGGGKTEGQARREGQASRGFGDFWNPQASGFSDGGVKKLSPKEMRKKQLSNVFEAWKSKQSKKNSNNVIAGSTGKIRKRGAGNANPTKGTGRGDGASGSTGRKRGSSSKKLASDLMEHKHAEFHSTRKKKGGKLAMKFDKVTDVYNKK